MTDYCTRAPDRILGLELSPCCSRHDVDYSEQVVSRLVADLRFLACFVLRGWREGGVRGVAKTPFYVAIGLVYFTVVRVFGGHYWRLARPPVHARSPARAVRRRRRLKNAERLRDRRFAIDPATGTLTQHAARRFANLIERELDDE